MFPRNVSKFIVHMCLYTLLINRSQEKFIWVADLRACDPTVQKIGVSLVKVSH